MAGTMINRLRLIRRNGRGITLVELIVVLVILGILASAGIGASVGYAKRAIIEQNQSNAETIYQAAQTALQQLNKSGGIQSSVAGKIVSEDTWIGYIISEHTEYSLNDSNLSPAITSTNKADYDDLHSGTAFANLDASHPNSSAHRIYVLTYYKGNTAGNQNKLVKDLLQPYFADSTVFQGTITIELDVEKSADAYGNIHYSAKCLSVFYDGRAKNGWPSRAFQSGDNEVPSRDATHRKTKSYVGYYDGYKGAAVDTVYLPKVEEGITVKKFTAEYEAVTPTPDPNITPPDDPAPGTTVTPSATPTPVVHTRLTWAATIDHATQNHQKLDHENLLGIGQSVYYRIVLKEGNSVKHVLILNEDFLLDKDPIDGNSHSFNYLSEFVKGSTKINGYDVKTDEYTAVYPENVTKKVTRKYIEVTAKVYVSSNVNDGTGSSDNDSYKGKSKDAIEPILMPLRITYVIVEPENPPPENEDDKETYIEYSLDLTGEGEAYVLTNSMTEAILSIYPNYFTNSSMKGINDTTGIIPFKKGQSAEIDQDKTKWPDEDDTNTETPP